MLMLTELTLLCRKRQTMNKYPVSVAAQHCGEVREKGPGGRGALGVSDVSGWPLTGGETRIK